MHEFKSISISNHNINFNLLITVPGEISTRENELIDYLFSVTFANIN